jgi:hypothetical protein
LVIEFHIISLFQICFFSLEGTNIRLKHQRFKRYHASVKKSKPQYCIPKGVNESTLGGIHTLPFLKARLTCLNWVKEACGLLIIFGPLLNLTRDVKGLCQGLDSGSQMLAFNHTRHTGE